MTVTEAKKLARIYKLAKEREAHFDRVHKASPTGNAAAFRIAKDEREFAQVIKERLAAAGMTAYLNLNGEEAA